MEAKVQALQDAMKVDAATAMHCRFDRDEAIKQIAEMQSNFEDSQAKQAETTMKLTAALAEADASLAQVELEKQESAEKKNELERKLSALRQEQQKSVVNLADVKVAKDMVENQAAVAKTASAERTSTLLLERADL